MCVLLLVFALTCTCVSVFIVNFVYSITQEPRVKQFRQQLEFILGEFYTIQDSLDPPIKPLMIPHIECVIRSLLPGWTTLSWNTMNIDAFLHRVHTSVSVLRELADKVASLLKEKVYVKLDEISETSLFDLSLATSKTWVRHYTYKLHLYHMVLTVSSLIQ